MATIWLELPYAMSARNFLRSGLVGNLAKRHRLVLLSPLSSDPAFQQEVKLLGQNCLLEPLVFYDKNTLRGFLQQSWDRVVIAPTETRDLVSRHQLTTHLLKFARLQREQPWLLRAQEFTWQLLKTIPGLKSLCEQVNWNLLAHPFYQDLARRYPPDLVVFTHAFEWRSQSLLQYVRAKAIPALALVHSWDNLSSKGVIRHPFQRVLVWNEVNRQEVLTYYPHFQPQDVQVVGIPQFNHYWDLRADRSGRAQFLVEMGLDPSRQLVSFFLGNLLRYPDQDYAIQILSTQLPPQSQLLVRLQPGWDAQDITQLKAQFPDVYFNVPEIADAATPYQRGWTQQSQRVSLVTDLIRFSDVIVNTSSTTTLEAAIFDVPIVSLAFDREPLPEALSCRRFLTETHYQPVINSGATWIAYSPQELISAVTTYLSQPDRDHIGREQLVLALGGPGDGGTPQRILHAIEQVLLPKTFP